jgi:alpha-tubulin suppressor-like RCC1 family protein
MAGVVGACSSSNEAGAAPGSATACNAVAPTSPTVIGSSYSTSSGTTTFTSGADTWTAYSYAVTGETAPSVTATAGSLALDANLVTLPSGSYEYVGAGVSVASNDCLDVSGYAGVELTLAGNPGACALVLIAVLSEDQGPSSGSRGLCKASSCYSPSHTFATTDFGETVRVPFSAFENVGNPVKAVDERALFALAWQLSPASGIASNGGASDSCHASVSVSNVSFYNDAPLTGATQISNGGFHACAVLKSGAAACWGDNSVGELGDGTLSASSVPVAVSGVTGATMISAAVTSATNDSTGGDVHTCAVVQGGSVSCWGGNVYGQLGNGTTATAPLPTPVTGLTGATTVSAGTFHTCAVLADGSAQCWGHNSDGELGNGSTVDSSVPVAVRGLTGATMIAAGNSRPDGYTCALVAGGAVECWGYGPRLGNGSTVNSAVPVMVPGLAGAISISAHNDHTCVALADGTVKCWGYNGNGELGDGSTIDSLTPVSAAGITGVTAVSAGAGGSCVLTTAGAVQCWGLGKAGGLAPVTVTGVGSATAVSAGAGAACALVANGGVECWGDDTVGELGDGTTTTSGSPVAVLAPM